MSEWTNGSLAPSPAVLLDRDGVINVRLDGHVRSWRDFAFLPGSLEAMRLLRRGGARVVVLTNQSVVGRGLIRERELDEIHGRMLDAVARAGGLVEAVLACVHAPADGCACRKPAPGLFLRAGRELAVDLSRSVMVGDSDTDVEAARAAGCPGVRIGLGQDLLHALSLPAVQAVTGAC